MPIYAYRCAACGHQKDVLQKMSDPPLHTCPACGAVTFTKQVTAAGFQLKGSGWYATDFKGSGAAPATPAKDGEGKATGADEPAAGSSADKPGADKSAADKPAADKPAIDKSAGGDKAAAKAPAAPSAATSPGKSGGGSGAAAP